MPASFRRVLDQCDADRPEGTNPTVFILFGDRRRPWLVGYSVEAMAEITARIDRMHPGDPNREKLEEFYYSNAVELPVDDNGRLVLSKELRAQVGIEQDAVFKARGKTFRIMAPAAEAPAANAMQDWLAEQPADFDIASLLPADPPPDGTRH